MKEEYSAVVGIDFGSSGTGFGLSYDYKKDKKILLGDLPGTGTDRKVPTEIILDDKGNILAFGAECQSYFKSNDKGYYFKDIKMNLYNQKKTIKSINTGKETKEFELTLVISKVLEKIKGYAVKQISGNGRKTDKIKWTITVPAIWDEQSKDIMIKAAEMAGLINADSDLSYFLTLEPEAASLHCLHNKAIDTSFMKTGKEYIVCDLGGGTADIVSHIIGNNRSLSEIASATGGDFGSNENNKKIKEKVFGPIFGFKNMEELKIINNSKEDKMDETELCDGWLELDRQIETYKLSLNQSEIDSNGKYTMLFPFYELFELKELKDKLESYNKNAQKGWQLGIKGSKKYKLMIPFQIIYDLMKDQAEKISKKINEITTARPNISHLIYVGGYSSCEILTNLITKNIGRLICLKPSDPGLAIIYGAVHFGNDPSTIVVRKPRYTIGIACNSPWEDKYEGKGFKIYDEQDNMYWCQDVFDPFIIKDSDIKYDNEIRNDYNMKNGKTCSLRFYKTLKKNPLLIEEEGVSCIGTTQFDAGQVYPMGERLISVIMKFGGTFFDIKAIHKKSGKEVKRTFKFE